MPTDIVIQPVTYSTPKVIEELDQIQASVAANGTKLDTANQHLAAIENNTTPA